MFTVLARNWWLIALRGAVAILFGILAFLWPQITLVVLVTLFGVYALLDGLFAIVAAFRQRQVRRDWWVLLLEGLLGVLAGLAVIIFPDYAALVLVYLIAIWAVLTGVLEIWAAILLRREIQGEWLLALSGLLSIVFGGLLFVWPTTGALALVWLIAAYAIVFGILLLILAWRLRGWNQHSDTPRQSTML